MQGSPRTDRNRRRAWTAAVGAVCALCFVYALWITRGVYPAPPDALHHGIVARNLARGNGFKINVIEYHVGGAAAVEHVPELHALLHPLTLAGLFALSSPQRALFRVPGFVYVALSGWVAFLYARRVFGAGAGLIACALTLSSGLLWLWAWLGTDDAGFAFWFLVTIFALDVAIETRSLRRFAVAGLAAAVALLQKLSGLILLAPLLALFFRREATLRTRLRWMAVWLAPFALALALSLARNRVASGSWMFRLGAIDWHSKQEGIEAFFRVYDSMPSLWRVLASLGPEKVLSIVLGQLGDFARAVLSPTPVLDVDVAQRLTAPSFVSLLGLAALALHARTRPRFATLVTLSLLGAAGFVCVIWHFETRFFTPLVPLLAISLGGGVAIAWRAAQTRGRVAIAVAAVGVGLGVVALSVGLFAHSLRAVPVFGGPDPCATALDWLRRESRPDDRILTFDPWLVAWATERPSIVTPAGTRAEVEKVVAWYRPTWVVVQPWIGRGESFARIQEMVSNPTSGFAATPAFAEGDCAVYRLTAPAP